MVWGKPGRVYLSRKGNARKAEPTPEGTPTVGERGIKPYIDVHRRIQKPSYLKTLRMAPKRQIFDIRPEEDSEFEKPYRGAGYGPMQNFYHSNFRKPFIGADPNIPIIPSALTEQELCGDSLMIARALPNPVDCSSTATLIMSGHDGEGNPWNQGEVKWEIVHKGDCGHLQGFNFVAPQCLDLRGLDVCFGCSATIRGTTPCGNSVVIVSVNADPHEVIAISGPESIVVSSDYDAVGGNGAITFSVSCGTINATTGVVSSVAGCCGTGTVTATDECGNSASMEVRFAIGTWVAGPEINYCGGIFGFCDVIIGGTKTRWWRKVCGYNPDPDICPCSCTSGCCCDRGSCLPGNPCGLSSACEPNCCYSIQQKQVSTWECP